MRLADIACATPCKNCPFRKDVEPFLSKERAQEILRQLELGESFSCHETVDYSDPIEIDEDGNERNWGGNRRQCAGATWVLLKTQNPNQLMQLGERLLGIDWKAVMRNGDVVFDSPQEMIDAQE